MSLDYKDYDNNQESEKCLKLVMNKPRNKLTSQKSKNESLDLDRTFIKDILPEATSSAVTAAFLREISEILIEYVKKENDRSTKVLDFFHPHELKDKISLEIPEKAQSLEALLEDCRNTLKYCVKTGHPRFFNQLSSGLDVVSMAAEWLTATVNANMFTYEIAPVFTLMEKVTLKKMRDYIGYRDGDGIFAPGGAISNIYAVNLARYKMMPDCKKRGNYGSRLVMFASEHCHYSIKGAAGLLGIGTDNVITIRVDERGKMRVSELEKKIQQAKARGDTPFMVCATAGTTVLGAVDPLRAIADICQHHSLWMHVDAAWGGGALLSKKHRTLLDGIERSQSVTWNPHKLMGVTLQCSALLLTEDGLLEKCNSMKANYLFQQDKHYDVSYDTGDKAIQCGRHVDIFKLWLMWRAKGAAGLEAQITKVFDLAIYLQDQLKDKVNFKMVLDEPEFTNVCFWYVPPTIYGLPEGREKESRLAKVAPAIKARMMNCGTTMVSYQPLDDKVNFFRMVLSNPAANEQDVDYLIAEIERLGQDL